MAGYEYGGSVFDTNGRQFGNTGKNANQVFGDVTNPTKQKQKTVNDVREFTMSSYRKLYKDLEGLHTSYLTTIKKAEEGHYINLTKGDRSGFIYKQYDDLYKKLEQRHNLYLQRIGGKQGNNTNVAVWANPNAQQKGTAKAGATAGASTSDTVAIGQDSAFADIADSQYALEAKIDKTVANTKAIGDFLVATNKNNRDIRKYVEELKSNLQGSTKASSKQAQEEKRGRKKQESDLSKVRDEITELVDDVGGMLIQGRYTSRVFDDILKTVKIFQKQESVADSVVAIVVMLVKEIFGFIADGVKDLNDTYESTYGTFGLYFERASNQYEQTALYTNQIDKKIGLLRQDGLDNNIAVTEWWKAQAGLLEKGFSVSQAEQASIQNVLLNKIAPTLDTNNQYFLDLQQQGMFNLTKSLGGIVESVRDTAGSSRVTMGSMSTIIDKLVPVELYTKRELMDDKARAYLSALENSGMATADAINLVNDSIEAYYDPYKGMTSGNVLQRVALAQMGGNPESWVDLIGAQIGLADMYTSGTPDALNQGAVNSVLGASWLNARANYGTINQTFLEELEKAMEEGYEPSDAYQDLEQVFRDDILQTAEQMMTIDATNSRLANDLVGMVQEISNFLQDLIHETMPRIEEAVVGIAEKLGVLMGGKEYQDEQLNKALTATSEEEKQKALKNAKNSAYLDVAESAFWDMGLIPMLGRGLYTKATTGEFETPWDRIKKVYNDDLETIATANVYGGNDYGAKGSTAKTVLEATPIYQAGKAYKKYMIDKPIEWAKGLFGVDEYGTGGYVSSPQLAVVGDNPYGEVISPIPQLTSAVMRGVNASNKNKPDTSDVEAVIIQVGEAIVKAIAENGGTIVFDNSTGLMSGGSKSSLKPIMGGKGGY